CVSTGMRRARPNIRCSRGKARCTSCASHPRTPRSGRSRACASWSSRCCPVTDVGATGLHTPTRERGGTNMRRTRPPEVVVVTGASAGIGRAVVREFARHGAHLGLLARGHAGLEAARAEVERLGGKALVLPLDVAEASQVEAAAAQVEEEFGPIDVW